MRDSQGQLSEGAIVRLWERSSGRRMTSDELSRVRGHALVTYLRCFSEEALAAAASAANPGGGDLDWRAWRSVVDELDPRPPADTGTPGPKRTTTATRRERKGRGQGGRGSRKSAARFANPDDSREIQTGAWKGRSPRAISDAELMKRLKKKYPNL